MNSPNLPNVIFSQGSEDGVTHCASLTGQMMCVCGQVHALASLSAKVVSSLGFRISGTSGQAGSISSRSAALTLSLGSRLQRRLHNRGSSLFNLTWSLQSTDSGAQYWRLRVSARRTSGNGSTSWPTATQRDWKSSASNLHGMNSRPLNETARLASWPTCTVKDASNTRNATANRSATAKPAHLGLTLVDAVSWVTPLASDSRGVGPNQHTRSCVHQAQLASWITPAAHEACGTPEQFLERKRKLKGACGVSLTSLNLQAIGMMSNGSTAETTDGGQLNPAHSRWLMGYPAEWDYCGATAMQLFRSSGRSSSARGSKMKLEKEST